MFGTIPSTEAEESETFRRWSSEEALGRRCAASGAKSTTSGTRFESPIDFHNCPTTTLTVSEKIFPMDLEGSTSGAGIEISLILDKECFISSFVGCLSNSIGTLRPLILHF